MSRAAFLSRTYTIPVPCTAPHTDSSAPNLSSVFRTIYDRLGRSKPEQMILSFGNPSFSSTSFATDGVAVAVSAITGTPGSSSRMSAICR